MEDSIVLGKYRVYPFDAHRWALEPVDGSKSALERARLYHSTLEDALTSLLDQRLKQHKLHNALVAITYAREEIIDTIEKYAERLSALGLPLTAV